MSRRHYVRQQQQQQQQYQQQHSKPHNTITSSRRQRIQHLLRLLPTLWLLCYCCCCCCLCQHTTNALEYTNMHQLSNCYDIHNGFNGPLNDTAPKQLLPMANGFYDSNQYAAVANNVEMLMQEHMKKQQHEKQQHQEDIVQQQLQQQQHPQWPLPLSTEMPNYKATPTHTGWQCCCWNATLNDEIECFCEGEALTRVPQTLNVPMQRLSISLAGLPRVRSTGLKKYASSLQDVVLTDLKHLECIEDGAFAGLKLLRTIYISHAPKLTYLSGDVFAGISETIKIIRIINSGLVRVPDLVHIPPANILQMIDLDNNQITRIDKTSINIKTDQLILANNEINYIDDSAFYGSQINKLILKQNRNLKEVHPNAFNGISMHELDLSGTSLVRLPSVGLEDIEQLRIENTHTLKTIPSIYYFKNLQRAYLTHSFHCCAFKFPSRHDPRRHAERMKEIEKWQRKCTKTEQDRQNVASKNFENASRAVGRSKKTEQTSKQENEETSIGNQNRVDDDAIKQSMGQWGSAMPSGVLYSRLARTELSVNDVVNETDDSDYMIDDDYMSETMIREIGIFHEEITINPDANQLDEYCGNFTFRKQDIECYPMPNALNPCEDVMGYQWLRISVWIVVTLAVVGNVAVLVVILSIRSENTPVSRFLMCHLAFADLCLGLYLLLIAAIDAHSMGSYFNYAYDWQYGVGCKVAGFLTVFASHLSVFTLTVITIERWLAITHAMYLNRRIKLRAAAYIMIAGWIYSIVMSLFPLFGISNYSSTSICLPMEIRDSFDISYLVAILGLNGCAFFIIAICYIQIYLSLGEETRHSHIGEMSVAKKMALLVFTNFSCWAPIAFFGLTALAGYPLINVTKSKILLVFFYPLNSCADPYLYAILTSQYRQDLYTLLGKFGICKDSALKYKNSLSVPCTTFTAPGSNASQRNSIQKVKQAELQLMLEKHEDFV